MPHAAVRLGLPALGFCLAAACSGSDAGRGSEGALTLIDSTVVAESDSTQVGHFAYLGAGPGKSFFVTDNAEGRILHYDETGELIRIIGRKGGGPGELQRPGHPRLLPGDSLLAVIDGGQRAFSIFDIATGAYRRRVPVPFQETGTAWTFRGDTAYVATMFAMAPSLYARWNMRTDSVDVVGAPPPAAMATPFLYILYGYQNVAGIGTRPVAQLPMTPGIVLLDAAGAPAGGLSYPPNGSRGIPADLAARHGPAPDPTAPMLGSWAAGLHVLPSGQVAVLTMDFDRTDTPGVGAENIRYFLSVVDVDGKRACVDTPLPVTTEAALPLPVFTDDRLVLLARHTEGTEVRSVLYRFRIDPGNCTWTPATETPPPAGP